MPCLNTSILSHVPLDIPPISAQRAIADVLDAADEAIRSTEQLIAKLQRVGQGLLGDILNRGVDERGRLRQTLTQAAAHRDGAAACFPPSWKLAEIGTVGEVKLGRQRSPKDETGRFMFPYLRVANVFDGRIDYSDVLRMNFISREREVYGLKEGDLLLNEGQSLELVGRCAIYDGPPGLYCFQNTLVRYRCGESLLPRFAYLTFKRWLSLGRFMSIAKQTTSIAHLGAGRFSAMRIPVPPLAEQRAIVQVFAAHSEREDREWAHLGKLRRMKQGLMEDLLAGRLRPDDREGASV